jgi:hypothetical protein
MEGSTSNNQQASISNTNAGNDDGFDILGMGTTPTQANNDAEEDLFGDGGFSAPSAAFINMPEESLVKKDTKGKSGNSGISIKGGFKKSDRMNSGLILALTIKNKSSVSLSDFVIQLKPNQFGMKITKPDPIIIGKFLFSSNLLAPGTSQQVNINIELGSNRNNSDVPIHPYAVYTAFKCSLDTFFFKTPIHAHLLFVSSRFLNNK